MLKNSWAHFKTVWDILNGSWVHLKIVEQTNMGHVEKTAGYILTNSWGQLGTVGDILKQLMELWNCYDVTKCGVDSTCEVVVGFSWGSCFWFWNRASGLGPFWIAVVGFGQSGFDPQLSSLGVGRSVRSSPFEDHNRPVV